MTIEETMKIGNGFAIITRNKCSICESTQQPLVIENKYLCLSCMKKDRLNKAIEVEDNGDWIYVENEDRYYSSLMEYTEDKESDELPEYVYATKPEYFELDIERILEVATDEFFEDCEDNWDLQCAEELKELKLAIDIFNEKIKKCPNNAKHMNDYTEKIKVK